MNIALVGATGQVGSRILAEALRRGHHVTAIVRDPSKLAPQKDLTVLKGDLTRTEELEKALQGQTALLAAFNPPRGAADFSSQVQQGYKTLLEAARRAKVGRVLLVGGAGSLEVAPGIALVDTPNFPAEYKVEASAMRDVLVWLRTLQGISWTMLSPAAFFMPGERTGTFRLGTDQFMVDAQGKSAISMEDFAVAFLDELETPKHPNQRFSIAY